MMDDAMLAGLDPAASYRVELARVARLDGLLLRGEITLTGDAVARLVAAYSLDIVLSAEKL